MKNEINQTSLELFLATAELNSFTAAADVTHFTQQAVSKSVKELDENLGVQLFSRDGRGLALTETGAAYADVCREYLATLSATKRKIASMQEARADAICVAFSARLSLSDELMDTLVSFSQITPGLTVTGYQGDVMTLLEADKADLALLLTEMPVLERDMYTREIAHVREFITFSPLVEEAHGADHIPADLWGAPYFVDKPSPSSKTETVFAARRRLKHWSLVPSSIEVLPNVQSVIATLRVRRGFTVSLDRFGVDGYFPSALRFPLPEGNTPLRLCCVWKRSSENRHIQPLVEYLCKALDS